LSEEDGVGFLSIVGLFWGVALPSLYKLVRSWVANIGKETCRGIGAD
jgi:hypothetical protein